MSFLIAVFIRRFRNEPYHFHSILVPKTSRTASKTTIQGKFHLFLKINRHFNLLSIQIKTTTFIRQIENWNVNLHNLDLTDLEMPNLDLYDLDLTDLNLNDLYLFELDPIRDFDCLVRL